MIIFIKIFIMNIEDENFYRVYQDIFTKYSSEIKSFYKSLKFIVYRRLVKIRRFLIFLSLNKVPPRDH